MKYLAYAIALAVALGTGRADAQTFTTLVQFTGTSGTANGWEPQGSLILSGTTLYGTTTRGGAGPSGGFGYGNVFSVGIDGANFQNLVSFTGAGGTASGWNGTGTLVLAGTSLYGTTVAGGANGLGNIFSVGTNGANYQCLVSFSGSGGKTAGAFPLGSLTLSGTTLYGMTSEQQYNDSYGNVFSVGTNGANFQNLVSFTGTGGTASGSWPYGALTILGSNLYGTTTGGSGFGGVFSVGANGTDYQNIVSFGGLYDGTPSGDMPEGSLTLSGTTLYGMTLVGGAFGYGNIFSVGTDGANYQNLVSLTGTSGTAIGENPRGSLTLSGTTLYGMTDIGGTDGSGNIFSVGIDGSGYQDLYDFTSGSDGCNPYGDLTLSGGTLFGMAAGGGADDDGTIFALTLPVPEPGALALVGAATAAIVPYRWRWLRSQRKSRR